MKKKNQPNISQAEENEFLDAMREIKTRAFDLPRTHLANPKSHHIHSINTQPETPETRYRVFTDIDWLKGEDQIHCAQKSLPAAKIRQLKQGKWPIVGTLDLHGLTVAQAAVELDCFISRHIRETTQCVLVIHGKGTGSPDARPVLKNATTNWVKQDGRVLAFCSATNRHGGTGAMYLLLKKGDIYE